MTDPTPTPTPREVPSSPALEAHLRWMRGQYPSDAQVGSILWREVHGPAADELRWLQHQATLAALAAIGDAPLTEKRLAELRWVFESSKSIIDEKCGLELLTAYTTLAAQLAAARAERDALREANTGWQRFADHAPGCYGDDQCHCGLTIFRARHATPARPTDTGRDG